MLDTNIFEEILEYEADYRLIKTLVAAQKIHLTITPIQIAELCRTGDVNPAKWDSLSPDENPLICNGCNPNGNAGKNS